MVLRGVWVKSLKESVKIKQKVLFLLKGILISSKESLISLQKTIMIKKRKYYAIKQISLIFSKESNKSLTAFYS